MVCVPLLLTAAGRGSRPGAPLAVISGGSQELVGFQCCPAPAPASMMTGMESLPRTGDALTGGLALLVSADPSGPCLIDGWKPACVQMAKLEWEVRRHADQRMVEARAHLF